LEGKSLKPLADRLRPTSLEEVVGQEHILGKGKILNKLLSSGHLTNMIFYGPPGTGKTTVANIAASITKKRFYKLNATNASVSDIKNIISDLDTLMGSNGVLLYLDEIQNFNKKQQQALLEYIENGQITLIASTADNPYFCIYKPILSRSNVFEFKPLEKKDIIKALKRAVEVCKRDFGDKSITYDEKALEYIADICGGDLRRALGILELGLYSAASGSGKEINITVESIMECSQSRLLSYDRDGDSHYDILSAFQKSIRGSDPDAAIHYLARLVKGGDLLSICRRLLVIAAEDVGLAYPQAISIVKACTDAALQLGFPEARIPLAQATILLATSPKSNSAICAIDSALKDLENKDVGDIPLHLKDAHYEGAASLGRGTGYKYPHDYENNYVAQQYLPDNIVDAEYYKPGKNKAEQAAEEYWKRIKSK
jgi:putative ATPase